MLLLQPAITSAFLLMLPVDGGSLLTQHEEPMTSVHVELMALARGLRAASASLTRWLFFLINVDITMISVLRSYFVEGKGHFLHLSCLLACGHSNFEILI